jgi:hypothetical protein
LPSAPRHSAKIFAECPKKSTRQRSLCRCTVCRAFFAECYTWQSLCRVFLRLRRVPEALGEEVDSGSATRGRDTIFTQWNSRHACFTTGWCRRTAKMDPVGTSSLSTVDTVAATSTTPGHGSRRASPSSAMDPAAATSPPP